MKISFIFFSLVFALFLVPAAQAGAPNCTDVTYVTTGSSYTASPTDCVIRVVRPFSNSSFEVNLPENGDTFVVQNGAPYTDDQCDNAGTEEEPVWICYPRSITVYSLDRVHNTVDGANSVTNAGMYLLGEGYRSSDTFVWDAVSNWVMTYDIWYPLTNACSFPRKFWPKRACEPRQTNLP